MIRSNQRFFQILHIVSDGVIVFLSFVFAFVLRFDMLEGEINNAFGLYFGFAVVAALLQMGIYACSSLYSSQRKERFRTIALRLFYSNALGYSILLMGLFWTKEVHFSRMTLGFFFVFETVAVIFKRYLVLRLMYHLRSKGYNQRQIVVVGSGVLADQFIEKIAQSPELGYKILGYVAKDQTVLDLDFLGDYDQLEDVLEVLKPDEVVVAMAHEDDGNISAVIGICEKTGTKMSMIPSYTQYFPGKTQVDFLHDIPMLHIRPIPLEHFGWASIKRAMDFVGSLLLIIALSPVLLITALGVALSSKGPIIFCQTRVGLNKKEFKMYKFRSMVVNSGDHTTWSKQTDSRKTKFGTFIRKCSLDELPQLFNVLKGEMSLVGPRPEIPHFVEQFKEEIPHYMVKHQVRPGITGWAQVNGFRGDTSIEGRIQHDIHYIEQWTLWMDIKILFLTLFKGMINQEK